MFKYPKLIFTNFGVFIRKLIVVYLYCAFGILTNKRILQLHIRTTNFLNIESYTTTHSLITKN